MNEELISIIIPCFNSSRFIKYTLNSVISQSYLNLEVLIIDDGSTDTTASIVKNFKDKRITYLYQENKGVNSARNLGIMSSKGEYIAFLDSDDVWEKDKLLKQMQVIDHSDIIYCNYSSIDECNHLINLKNRPYFDIKNELDPFLIGRSVLGSGSSVLIRKRIINSVGLFNEDLKYAEDQEFWTRIAWQGFKFCYVDEKLVQIRVHNSSVQATANNHMILAEYKKVINSFLCFKNLKRKHLGIIYNYNFSIIYSYSTNYTDLIHCYFKILQYNYKLLRFKHLFLLIKFIPRNIFKKI